MATTYREAISVPIIYAYHITSTSTTLDGAIGTSDVTITVADASSFADSGFLQIENETIKYTGKTATTFTSCTRGSEDSTKATHIDTTVVYQSEYSVNRNYTSAFDYFDDDVKVNDCVYFGWGTSNYDYFEDLKLYIGTAFAATSATMAWQYSKKSTWYAIPHYWDGTNGFTATGECQVLFDTLAGLNAPTLEWEEVSINNSSERKFIRVKITAIDTPTEGGANSTNTVNTYKTYLTITGTNTFTTLHTADLAGTSVLLDGIIDSDPDTFCLGHEVRPCEQGAIKLTVSCTARAGATCDISGTDSEGIAISETGLDISSGSATTIKSYKTVDTDGITVDGMTNGDTFDISQGRWGVVWRMGEGDSFQIDRRLIVGDGTTTTTLTDSNKLIRWKPPLGQCMTGTANATITLGKLEDETLKITSNGCSFVTYTNWPFQGIISSGDSTCYLYSCSASVIGGSRTGMNGTRVWNCSATNLVSVSCPQELAESGIYNTYISNTEYGQSYSCGFHDGSSIFNCTYGIYWYSTYGEDNYNCTFRENNILINALSLNKDHSLINPDYDAFTIYWHGTDYGKKIYEKYTLDIKVTDKNNNDIDGALVTLTNKDGEVFSVETSSGVIAEQTVSRGYYNHVNGNTRQGYSPFTLTIKKTGYQTYSSVIDLTKKIDWKIKLENKREV